MSRTRIIGVLALSGLLCLVGGCGSKGSDAAVGGGPSSTSTTAGGVDASVSTPPADPGSASASTGAVDVCSLMSPSALKQITGTTFTKTEPDSVAGAIYSCNYTSSDFHQLTISVTVSGGAIGYQADLDTLHTMGDDPNPVSGVGDKAFSQNDPKGSAAGVGVASFASFGALYGDVFVQLSGLDYVNAAQGTQIANQIHAAL
ncbi:MAG: hypothetical protein WB797_17385 [Nocardioides sp.]